MSRSVISTRLRMIFIVLTHLCRYKEAQAGSPSTNTSLLMMSLYSFTQAPAKCSPLSMKLSRPSCLWSNFGTLPFHTLRQTSVGRSTNGSLLLHNLCHCAAESRLWFRSTILRIGCLAHSPMGKLCRLGNIRCDGLIPRTCHTRGSVVI
jgi:hypothetical protein